MALVSAVPIDEIGRIHPLPALHADNTHAHGSAVSWGAIFAGAAAAAALSLILLILGTGLGLSSVSPWKQDGVSAMTFGVTTIVWLTFTQLLASGMGGYLAGRLRSKWISVHTDEVYFRDTAHGFLVWAVASLVTAGLLTSVIGSIVSGGIQAGASIAGGVATTATVATAGGVAAAGSVVAQSVGGSDPMGYFVDSLFRKDATAATAATVASEQTTVNTASEVSRIFMSTVRSGPLSAEDSRYVGQLVAQRTGLTQADAEKRVNETFTRMQIRLREAEVAAREAADKARKASAYAALWLFISLLAGAFVASLCATYGGRRRDA